MPGTEVVIPWSGRCPHRMAARHWVCDWYARNFPQWRVTIAATLAEPWCKAAAAMPAVLRSRADVVVLADADVFCDVLGPAVRAIETGSAWAVPHNRVVRLDEAATEQLLVSGIAGTTYAQAPYAPVLGGGLLVARRDVLLDTPLDRRFLGWGQEDESHGFALRCLHGQPWQGKGDLIHLWHPPQERQSRSIGSDESWKLRRRYRRARGDAAAMRALIQEAA